MHYDHRSLLIYPGSRDIVLHILVVRALYPSFAASSFLAKAVLTSMARVYPCFFLASNSFFDIHASRSPGSRVVEGAQRSFQARECEGAQDGSSAVVEDGAVVGSVVMVSAMLAEVVE